MKRSYDTDRSYASRGDSRGGFRGDHRGDFRDDYHRLLSESFDRRDDHFQSRGDGGIRDRWEPDGGGSARDGGWHSPPLSRDAEAHHNRPPYPSSADNNRAPPYPSSADRAPPQPSSADVEMTEEEDIEKQAEKLKNVLSKLYIPSLQQERVRWPRALPFVSKCGPGLCAPHPAGVPRARSKSCARSRCADSTSSTS